MTQPRHIKAACDRATEALLIANEKPAPRFDAGGGSPSTAAEGAPTPAPIGLISAKRELRDLLLSWCAMVRDGLDVVRTYDLTEESMLDWLGTGERADYLAAHDTAVDFLDEITLIVKQIEQPYLPRFGRKYLGHHGGGDVYAREGQTEVTLANGETHRVTSIQAFNASQMLEQEGTASEVADIIKGFFGHELTPKQIANTRDKDERRNNDQGLTSTRKQGNAHIYRVWDVLNRMC